ncbi:MAG: hypothetical protein KVP17_000507 [Porospora cf. gigantea B]|uniref:uncharacterized protein n=1 Tax=Porospora cf. gigantea B TaxID=2853592 RepID=UPI003571CAFB|nr:MAG: hypothetical protein KVP17_000507 [Porospora cf. gigantea B]
MWMDDIDEADCLDCLANPDPTAGSTATVLLPSDTAEHILERSNYGVYCETGDVPFPGLSTLAFIAPANKRMEFLDLLQVSLFATQFHRADMMHALTANRDGIDDSMVCAALDVLMAQQVPSDQLCRTSIRNSLFASTPVGDYEMLLDRLLHSEELGNSADIMRAVWGPTVESGALQNPGVDREAWMVECIKGEGGLIAPTEAVFRSILVGHLLKNGHAAESINQNTLVTALQELHDADDATKAAIFESSLVGFCLFNRVASTSEDDELLTACLGDQMVKGVPADKIGKWVRHIFEYLGSAFPSNVGHDVLDFMKMLLDRGLTVGQLQKTMVEAAIDSMLPDDPIVRNNLFRGFAMNSIQAKKGLLRSLKLDSEDDDADQACLDTFWNEHDQLNDVAKDDRVGMALRHFQRIHGTNWVPREQREPTDAPMTAVIFNTKDSETKASVGSQAAGSVSPVKDEALRMQTDHGPFTHPGLNYSALTKADTHQPTEPIQTVDLRGLVALDTTLEDADPTLEDVVNLDSTLEDVVDLDPTLEDVVDLDPTLKDSPFHRESVPRHLHQGGTRPARRSL